MLNWLKNLISPPEPAGPPQLIQRFDSSQATISTNGITVAEDGWHLNAAEAVTFRLFEVEPGDIENGMLSYSASVRSEEVVGQGYLEMWCQFPGQGEFFSKGLNNPVKGSNNWASYEIPFYLKKSQTPDILKLNFTFEGGGQVWLKDIEVSFTPFK